MAWTNLQRFRVLVQSVKLSMCQISWDLSPSLQSSLALLIKHLPQLWFNYGITKWLGLYATNHEWIFSNHMEARMILDISLWISSFTNIYSRVRALSSSEVLGQLLQVTLKRLILQVSHLFRGIRAFLEELLIFLDLTQPGLSTHISHSQSAGLGVSALSLSRLTMPQCVSCLLSLLSSASPAPHPTSLLVSAEDWGRSQPLAIPTPCPWPLTRPVLRVSSVSPLTGVTGPPASGHSPLTGGYTVYSADMMMM